MFFFHLFSLPAQELEAKPQNLTEDTEKKKQKKPKKMSNIHNSITGFEEAFEQFATSSVKNSKNAIISSQVGSEIPDDKKLDVSATQVRLIRTESQQPYAWWRVIVFTVQIAFVSILHKYLLN